MSLFRAAFVNKLVNPEAYMQANLNKEKLTKSSATETGWILQATLLRNHPKLSGKGALVNDGMQIWPIIDPLPLCRI